MGGTIFISYPRGQDAGFAGRLFDRLERTFRRKALFMDVDSIAPGQDFVSILETRVAECDVLLALIGRGWLTATDEADRRRLDNPEDFVRIEIATALPRKSVLFRCLSMASRCRDRKTCRRSSGRWCAAKPHASAMTALKRTPIG